MKTAQRSPRRRALRRWALRGVIVTAALALAVVAIEVFVHLPILSDPLARQMRGTVEEGPDGRLRTVPGHRGTQTVGGGVQHIRHNSVGMRGPDYGPKTPGELRVLFLGDSVTYGTGVEETDTFAVCAADLLTERLGRPVTAGISACPGFGSVDHVHLLRAAAASFTPDLVVSCVFVENDLYDNLSVVRAVVGGYPLFHGPQVRLARSSWRARAMLRFKTAWLIEQALRSWLPALALDATALAPTAEERARWDGVAPDQSVVFLEQTGTVPALDRLCGIVRDGLVELQRAAGETPVCVVLLPSFVQYVPGVFEHLASTRVGEQPHAVGSIQARLTTICAELGLPARDLLPDLRAEKDAQALLIPNDFHFNVPGNRRVAELLAPWLEAQLRKRG